MRTKEERMHNEEVHWNKRLNNLKNVPEKLNNNQPVKLKFSTLDDLKATDEGIKLKNNHNLLHEQTKEKRMMNKLNTKQDRQKYRQELADELAEELNNPSSKSLKSTLEDSLEYYKNGYTEVLSIIKKTTNSDELLDMTKRLKFIEEKIDELTEELNIINR